MALILLLVCITEKQIADQPIFLDGIQDPYAADYLFIGTPYGIYTFDRQSERWSRITHANDLPDDKSTILGLDEGILWVATPGGLASADVKIHDWLTYDLVGSISGLAFDDEYVWVSADSGLWRFDKYVETWETIATVPIQDITREGGFVWCASDSGIFRFDRAYEKFERAPGAPVAAYGYVLDTPQRLWFFGPQAFAALEKETERWSAYRGFTLEDIAHTGDSLFAVTDSTVVLFDPATDTWAPYKDLAEISDITGISIAGNDLYLTTEHGLMVYSLDEKTGTTYTQAHGLHVEQLIDAYPTNDYIFVASTAALEYLNLRTNIWNTEVFTAAQSPGRRIFSIDDAGAHARLVPGTDTRLQGRASYMRTWIVADSVSVSDYENVNLKLINKHESGRLLSLYYDDTDPDQLMYGFGYRGHERDVLYRTNGGILNTEYYEFDLIPSFSYLGANTKLRAQNHSLDVQGGYLKSRVHTDFFTGTSLHKEFLRQDTEFAKYFYYIYDGPQLVIASWDTVFVDDNNALNNSIDTRRGYTLAGIIGDFDILINGIDYYIDYSRGVIQFLHGRDSTDIIVLNLGGSEIIIQSEAVSDHMLENVYFLAPDMLPHSLRISFTDTAGMNYPLSAFGLDEDSDNLVDPAYVDYHLGYLTFPAMRPFPDEVYETGLHIFTMHVQCASRSNIYYLSNTPVLKMSETVYVDGDAAARGSDYIVDYTSGALVFLTEGLVNDFSEIEVQYSSVDRDRDDIFYSVQPNIAFSKNVTVAPGFSSVDEQNIAHISAKVTAGTTADKNIQFIPQAAYTTDHEWSQDYALLANYHLLSFSAAYRGLSDSFDVPGANLRKWGMLRHQGTVSARIEPVRHVQCETSLRKEIMTDSLNNELNAQYIQGSIAYTNPGLPNGSFGLGTHRLPDQEKNTLQAKMNYTLQVLRTKIKLYTVAGHVSVVPDTGNTADEYEYIAGGSLVLPIPINSTWYFRKSNVYEHDTIKTRTDELRGNVSVDIIPGFYYTGSYNIEAESYVLATEQDLSLQHYLYNNLSIAPGRWFRPLSIINIMCGSGRTFDQYVSALPLPYARPPLLFSPVTDGSVSSINGTDAYYLTVQLNPVTGLVLWGKHTISDRKAASYAIPEPVATQRNEVRIEFEPLSLGFFSLYWDRKQFRTYPEKTTDNLFGEWIRPWSARLRTRFTTNYYTVKDAYGEVFTSSNELRTNFQTLVRFNARSYATFDIGGSRKENIRGDIQYTVIPGAGFDINLLTSVYLQCAYEANVLLDSLTTHTVTAKITGQF